MIKEVHVTVLRGEKARKQAFDISLAKIQGERAASMARMIEQEERHYREIQDLMAHYQKQTDRFCFWIALVGKSAIFYIVGKLAAVLPDTADGHRVQYAYCLLLSWWIVMNFRKHFPHYANRRTSTAEAAIT